MATAADGTQPTGMYSGSLYEYVLPGSLHNHMIVSCGRITQLYLLMSDRSSWKNLENPVPTPNLETFFIHGDLENFDRLDVPKRTLDPPLFLI